MTYFKLHSSKVSSTELTAIMKKKLDNTRFGSIFSVNICCAVYVTVKLKHININVDSIARIVFTSFYKPNCLFGGLPSFFFFFLGKRGDSSETDEKATGAAGSGRGNLRFFFFFELSLGGFHDSSSSLFL